MKTPYWPSILLASHFVGLPIAYAQSHQTIAIPRLGQTPYVSPVLFLRFFVCGLIARRTYMVDKIFSGNKPNVSETISASIIREMMMEAEMGSETLGFNPQLTRLVAREDFIEFSRRESFKFYKTIHGFIVHQTTYVCSS
jgi:hypothetical protein